MKLTLHHINLSTDTHDPMGANAIPYSDWGNTAVAGWSQIFSYHPDGTVIEVCKVDPA
jgi:hypothetical protein